jgi:hypothetical protein
MEGLADNPVECLRAVNRELRWFLETVAPGGDVRVGLCRPELLAVPLRALERAAEGRAAGSAGDHRSALADLLDEYRRNLQRLQTVLPELEAQVRQEHSRLDAERRQLEVAAVWASAARCS